MGTEFLINQLEDPNFPIQQVMLLPELVIRQSTSPHEAESSSEKDRSISK